MFLNFSCKPYAAPGKEQTIRNEYHSENSMPSFKESNTRTGRKKPHNEAPSNDPHAN